MTTNKAVCRVGVTLVGLASAVFLAVGCSSDSNGKPPTGGLVPGGNNQGASQGGGQGNGGNSAPGGGAVAGDFCKDFTSIGDLKASDFTSPDRAKKVLAVWDRLAAEAPAPIKADVQAIDDFLQTVESGHPDVSKIQKLAQMNVRIGRYIQANC